MSVLVRIGFVLMIPAVVVCAAVAQHGRSTAPLVASAAFAASRSIPDPAAEITTAVSTLEAQQNVIEDRRGAVDLYGNDVTDAVATYKLDADGSLYELHSPQTELPRLASPKS